MKKVHQTLFGAHWWPWRRRWCINLVPCVTPWITLAGGDTP